MSSKARKELVTETSILACYQFLRKLHPFCDWDLPAKIECAAIDDAQCYGEFIEQREINISRATVWEMSSLVRTMAHEMVHLRQSMLGKPPDHDKLFYKLAKEVCLHFGWRHEEF